MKKIVYTMMLLFAMLGCKDENVKPVDVQQPEPKPKPSKVLMVVSSNNKLKNGDPAGYFLPEAIEFYKIMKQNGVTVDVASPDGGKAPMYHRASYINMYKNALAETGLLNRLDSSLKIADMKPDNYIAIYYVGGFACLFDFPDNIELATLAAEIYEKNNGVVAAVCHGPAGLLNIKLSDGNYLIKGRKITSRMVEEDLDGISRDELLQYYFPFLLQEELQKLAPVFTHGKTWEPFVQVDGRIVTGQGPEATPALTNEVLKLIK
ncbi:MAG: type 1 glutamine amidotransferase domain-containing protein [Bacteroidia bacterium]